MNLLTITEKNISARLLQKADAYVRRVQKRKQNKIYHSDNPPL